MQREAASKSAQLAFLYRFQLPFQSSSSSQKTFLNYGGWTETETETGTENAPLKEFHAAFFFEALNDLLNFLSAIF
jgi:hypothetical protein